MKRKSTAVTSNWTNIVCEHQMEKMCRIQRTRPRHLWTNLTPGLLLLALVSAVLSAPVAQAKLRMPVITEDPVDVTVRKHEPTTLNCKADGNPSPIIEWYKDGEKVRTTGNRMLLPSGALFFLHVIHNKRDADTGIYWCVARNELGTARSRNASVAIDSPHKQPRITEHPVNTVVKKNEAATLSCKAEGKPNPVIEWYKDGEKLRITDNRVVLPSGSLFFLHARVGPEDGDGVYEADMGTYWCVARNEVGRAKSQNAVLEVADAPSGPPLDVLVKVINQTSVHVSWLEPSRHTRNGPLSGYAVQLTDSIGSAANYTASASAGSLVLGSLNPSSTYEIRVFALNSMGSGPGSPPLSLRTDPRGDFIRTQDKESLLVKGRDTEFKDALKQPWFIIIAALTVMFITSSAVLIFLMRQISISKKPINTHVTYTTTLQKSDYNGGHGSLGGPPGSDPRDRLWMDQAWEADKSNTASKLLNTRDTHGYANKLSEYSVIENEIGNDLYEEVADNHGMSTFGKKEDPISEPSPYAMTTIINIPGNSSFRGRQYQQQQQAGKHYNTNNMQESSIRLDALRFGGDNQSLFDAKEDSFHQAAPQSLDREQLQQMQRNKKMSPGDSGHYTTDEYGMPIRKKGHVAGKHSKRRTGKGLLPGPPKPSSLSSCNGSSDGYGHGRHRMDPALADLLPSPPEPCNI